MRSEIIAIVLSSLFMASLASRADELDDLISLAFSNSPTLHAANQGPRQAEAARDATDEFLDPHTTAAAGHVSGNGAATPFIAAPAGLPAADTYGVGAGVEVPIRPGFYAGAGVSEQYLVNPPNGFNSGYSTLVGAQIRIPLMQDRGFSLWRQRQARQRELLEAADAHLLETRQAVRHAVELAYFTYLVEIANAATSWSAIERSQKLLDEAEELVRLQVVPEYQLAPARLELALRREEICAVNQAIDTARLRLSQVLGMPAPSQLTTNSDTLITRATSLQLPKEPISDPIFAARGALCEIEALAAAASAETRSLDDQLRPDLGLSLRGVWAPEDSSSQTINGEPTSSDQSSVAAVLVWTRPWSQTGARARLRESRARESQLAEVRNELLNKLAADLATAYREFTGAGERLKQINIAVEQARQTLEAEAERFRLGEGRSRNVLDAQNDLNKAYRARNAIVAALLTGHSNFRYASGYQDNISRTAPTPPLGDNDHGHQ